MIVNDGQPLGRRGFDLEARRGGVEAEEAVEHHLGDEDAFEEFPVKSESAGDIAALHGAARGVFGVVARGSRLPSGFRRTRHRICCRRATASSGPSTFKLAIKS